MQQRRNRNAHSNWVSKLTDRQLRSQLECQTCDGRLMMDSEQREARRKQQAAGSNRLPPPAMASLRELSSLKQASDAALRYLCVLGRHLCL